MAARLDVSIVVSPRERFTCLPGALRSLFDTIPVDVPVFVVEGGSPKSVKSELQSLKMERDFHWISEKKMILPSQARNIGGRMVNSKYIVFADNDVIYSKGWLHALVKHADKHDSVTVGPLILIGPQEKPTIHHAGGELISYRDSDRLVISDNHRLANVKLGEADLKSGAPVKSEVCEFHCLLMKRDFFERMEGLNERLVTWDHVDLALRVKQAGLNSTFCKESVVTYNAMVPFKFVDLRYLVFRWDQIRSARGMKSFYESWNASEYKHSIGQTWVRPHRHRAIMSAFGLGTSKRIHRIIGRILCPTVELFFSLRNFGHSRDKDLYVPPKVANPLL